MCIRNYKDIVIMGSCNLKCYYCGGFHSSVDEDGAIKNLEKILNQFEMKDTAYRVECRGEISLYPKIMSYLESKAESGYHIEILSNGLELEHVCKPDTKLHVIVSLDGHTQKMNRQRGLTQSEVDRILDVVFLLNAEIQCVYFKQKISEINDFIRYLQNRGFHQLLHIFPCIIHGEHATLPIQYDELIHADFLAPKEYFEHWTQLYQHKKRDFTCDYFMNGYTYYINENELYMMKCDGGRNVKKHISEFGAEKMSVEFDCGMCINHNDYNNSRRFLNK